MEVCLRRFDGLVAGQHATILGASPVELGEAVRHCWASLWSERAVAYRPERGISFDGELMAVLLQPLLPAEASAVVFTRDPFGGVAEEVAVCAVAGIGEPLVSGSTSACTMHVDRATLAVVAVDRPAANGGPAADPPIGAEETGELVDLALRIERGMGAPVDVEAAFLEGAWHFLQTRPITAGIALPREAAP